MTAAICETTGPTRRSEERRPFIDTHSDHAWESARVVLHPLLRRFALQHPVHRYRRAGEALAFAPKHARAPRNQPRPRA